MEKLQQDLLKNANKLVLGSERNLKLLKRDKLKRVYLASNCKEEVREEVKRGKVEVIELKVPNSELGMLCKKPFSISIIGLSR